MFVFAGFLLNCFKFCTMYVINVWKEFVVSGCVIILVMLKGSISLSCEISVWLYRCAANLGHFSIKWGQVWGV